MADNSSERPSETFVGRPERSFGTFPGRSPESRIHVVSARTSANPYAALNMFCLNVKTREHAQFTGCISFAVFICLTVALFMILEGYSIFYIIGGIIVYAFLAESLFRQPKTCSIIAYLIFEVGFVVVFRIV